MVSFLKTKNYPTSLIWLPQLTGILQNFTHCSLFEMLLGYALFLLPYLLSPAATAQDPAFSAFWTPSSNMNLGQRWSRGGRNCSGQWRPIIMSYRLADFLVSPVLWWFFWPLTMFTLCSLDGYTLQLFLFMIFPSSKKVSSFILLELYHGVIH